MILIVKTIIAIALSVGVVVFLLYLIVKAISYFLNKNKADN